MPKQNKTLEDLIIKDGTELIFKNLSNPKVIYELIDIINSSKPLEKNWILNFKGIDVAYPNTCVPLIGIIEGLSEQGHHFEYYYLNEYLKKISLSKPLQVKINREIVRQSSLDRIWKFESADDVYLLVDSFVTELSQVIVSEGGVLEGFEWSINEVLDNVLQHSGKNFGYVMGQVHIKSKRFAFCVYDSGQGIYNSLLQSQYKPTSAVEALQLAVKEGITRDKKIGQGNGLWGLHQIVSENAGILNISSNSASYNLLNSKSQSFSKLPQLPVDNGCIVDFQLDYSKAISLSQALGGYQPVNIKIDSLEDDRGNIVVDLSKKESGVGTRKSGEKIRNEIINLYKQTNKQITIDFNNIKIVSSSFADELIGKLVSELSFYGFNNLIKLKNMNDNVQSIVQRSVAQRMMESFNEKK